MSTTGVSWISTHLNPSIKNYFDFLIEEDGYLKTRKVHDSYQYPAEVECRRIWPHIGIFYGYLIRKEINNILQRTATDRRAQAGVNRLHKLFTKELPARIPDGVVKYSVTYDKENNIEEASYWIDDAFIETLPEEINQLRTYVDSYKVYKNPANPTLSILEDIYYTAMLHVMYFEDDLRPTHFSPKLINEDNIKDTLKYVRSLDLSCVEPNPIVDCHFFLGDADVVMHDSILEIKISKYHYAYNTKTDNRFKTAIYQMILYGFGFFLRDGREIQKFRIYNPLQGVEYVLTLPNLDYDLLFIKVGFDKNAFCW